jgi:cation diffusion facilitator CzcD-associated flavoprotein CzcO
MSSLPGVPFAADDPRYVSRARVVDYLEHYAARFDLKPRFGESVHSVRRRDGAWLVESTSSTISARDVVIASGNSAEPITPAVPGIAAFTGTTMHSAEYKNPKPFVGQSVLVIGMGNTGAEIALDLAEGGAQPTISIRNGAHIAPRDLLGIPIQVVATIATSILPAWVNDAIFPPILDLALGRLATYGIRRPKDGILTQVAAGKIPVLDVGTVARIRDGTIRMAPAISTVTADGAVFADGSERKFGAIVFATGYRATYRDFLQADIAAGEGGAPRSTDPTLHFVGFRNRVTGLLREISREAVRVVDEIAARRPA